MSTMITFYDVPSSLPEKTWSVNVWKIRYALNFKGLPYKTEWIEYPDIEKVARELGAKPTGTRAGKPLYTIPMIHDDSYNVAIADSIAIAEYLDETYPNHLRLMPVGTFSLHMAFLDAFRPAFRNAGGLYSMSRTISSLNPPSAEMYKTNAETKFGRTVAELTPSGEVMDGALKEYESGLEAISKWYKDEASTFVGDQISFSDILLGSYLRALKGLWGAESEYWKKLASFHGGKWGQLLKDLEKYEGNPDENL
ncbi:hypothetical protein C8J56DRAFT_871833 [Mycena floridula]|nr:hypothetical protein C8J56DRAFT_871833 [Mycena floridula]